MVVKPHAFHFVVFLGGGLHGVKSVPPASFQFAVDGRYAVAAEKFDPPFARSSSAPVLNVVAESRLRQG